MKSYTQIVAILFALFAVVNTMYLHRVPGLMGDEASEGENVYELLNREGITLQGERSYIGPLIDYVRVPFIKVFGYTTLAVRLPVLLASLASFGLAASIFRRWWGENLSLFPLVAVFFSLPYLTHQRLGWAITLFPFFFLLTIWLAQREWNYKWVLVGFIAGLGLHTHIMFLPTLFALLGAYIVAGPVTAGALSALTQFRFPIFSKWAPRNSDQAEPSRRATRILISLLTMLIGFWAAFGTQFVMLQMNHEDQGDPVAVGEVMKERVAALPQALPFYISGSSYVAHYTGVELAPWVITSVTWLVIILALVGVILTWRSKVVWLWLGGLAVHLSVLLYMIDRFSLRYFVMFVLGMYVVAGLGLGKILIFLARLFPRYRFFLPAKTIGLAVMLVVFWLSFVLLPFLRAGGSVVAFSLGNRVDSASALVDVRPLLSCVRGAGSVGSENVHIYNRLLYLSHHYSDLEVTPEDAIATAQYLVHYRTNDMKNISPESELCPQLSHFVVERK